MPNQIEQLVAYLDGELNDEQTAAIEERLRREPELRQMAEELDRTWGMLDALEPVSAGEEFSQKTMKAVITTGSAAVKQRPWSVATLLSSLVSSQALAWFGIGVIGTGCGFGIAALRGPSEESARATQLLRQIDVLDRYPEYSIVRDVESLGQLELPNSEEPVSQEEE
jgi:anti-sigma factor RsiW